MIALRTVLRIALAAGAASLGAGCATGDGGADASSGPAPGGNDALVLAADDKSPGKDDDSLVPKTARLAAEGSGDLSFKATRDGFVYVIDRRDKTKIWEGPIDKDETLTIAPYRNVIEIDGKRVKRVKDLNNKHVHRIFFEREGDHGRDHDRRDRKDR